MTATQPVVFQGQEGYSEYLPPPDEEPAIQPVIAEPPSAGEGGHHHGEDPLDWLRESVPGK